MDKSNDRHWPAHALAFLLGAVLSAGVHATGVAGAHVKEFQNHIDSYAADVDDLAATLDGIADAYADGEKVTDDLDAFIQQWEEVRFHGAVETVTTPLYPPIWAAISRLRQAIEKDAPAAEVRRRSEALTAALHEGLGALRYAAHQRRQGGGQAAAGDDHGHGPHGQTDAAEEIERISASLDRALGEYRRGKVEPAKSLVQAAYLQRFEGLEGELIERDPELVAALEEDFNGTLPNLMESGAPVAKVAAVVAAMKTKLRRAVALLAKAEQDKAKVF